MDNTNEMYEIINKPEYVSYYRLYNAGIIAILILILIIPIVLIVYAIYKNNIRQSSWAQNIDSKNMQKHNQFLVENNLPSDINDKCLEFVRWVYSNRHTEPVYKKCNIRSLADAHNYVICYNNSDQVDSTDKSMVCGFGNNFDKTKCIICSQ